MNSMFSFLPNLSYWFNQELASCCLLEGYLLLLNLCI
jgi:hypothetical protein